MNEESKANILKIFLIVTGLFFLVGLYPMMNFIAPESWGWTPRQSEYEQMIVIIYATLGVFFAASIKNTPSVAQMIVIIYATLGVFLILAAKNPKQHRSLLWFTVWSSITHGGLMFIQALVSDGHEHDNLVGDVPALFAVAIVLWYLMPKQDLAE